MKLLFVLPEFGPNVTGGIATYYRHLLPELARHGHDLHVIVAGDDAAEPHEHPGGVTVARVDAKAVDAELRSFDALVATPLLQRRVARARAAWRLARGGDGFDVVETTDYGTLFAPWAALGDRPPLVVQLHGSNGQLMGHDPLAGEETEACVTRLMEVSLLRGADELQSYGGPNAREWAALLGREVVHLWPAWRPQEGSKPAALLANVAGLVVGRVQSWKGPSVLCEALRALGRDAPTIGWVGADTYCRRKGYWTGDRLRATYPELWGQKLVPFGRRNPQEAASLQAAAGFVVVPSTWDVFNFSAAEAMGRGRVVICSEGAGAAALIRDGESGFRCPAGDATALAERIRRAYEGLNDDHSRRMGAAAQAAVAAELDPAKIAGQRLARYEALAKGRTPADRPDLSGLTGFGEPSEDPLALLDGLPLRRLVRYALQRGLARLLKAFGR
jgi:glycosyltransferase involved in cell wall biosynthesis